MFLQPSWFAYPLILIAWRNRTEILTELFFAFCSTDCFFKSCELWLRSASNFSWYYPIIYTYISESSNGGAPAKKGAPNLPNLKILLAIILPILENFEKIFWNIAKFEEKIEKLEKFPNFLVKNLIFLQNSQKITKIRHFYENLCSDNSTKIENSIRW